MKKRKSILCCCKRENSILPDYRNSIPTAPERYPTNIFNINIDSHTQQTIINEIEIFRVSPPGQLPVSINMQ